MKICDQNTIYGQNHNIKIGKLGETLAGEFLSSNGCKVIDKNFYTRFGEIDLIAQKADEILFIEVKTRTSNKFGYPESAVGKEKIDHLLKAVKIYMRIKNISSYWRLDTISVELDIEKRNARIRWFKNVSIDF